MAEVKITKDNYQNEVLDADIPVVLDFWAPWCGPCQMLSPVMAEIAEQFDGKIKVGKVNVDQEGELASQFGVSSIPTVVVMRGGQPKGSFTGYRPLDNVLDFLENKQCI